MTPDPHAAVPTHLDLDQLADALAGETPEHLTGCSSCAGRLAELRAAEVGVVAALRALPDPPVPDELGARLTAAFAAEPPLGTAPVVPGGTVTALPARAPRRRVLPAAAAAVLLVSGGSLGYALVSGGTGGSDSATSDSGGQAAAGSDLVLNASGTDYADSAAVAGALPGVLAGSAVALDSAAAASQAQEAAPAPTSGARSSTTLEAPAAATAGDPLARLRTPAGLADCLSAVLPPEEPDLRPRALDYATYQGLPALAVVLPDPDPAKLSVYVVGADCAAADARVLSFLRVDAP